MERFAIPIVGVADGLRALLSLVFLVLKIFRLVSRYESASYREPPMRGLKGPGDWASATVLGAGALAIVIAALVAALLPEPDNTPIPR